MTKVTNLRPVVGDKIRVDRFGYSHFGIYVGKSWFDARDVVHNDKWGGVIRSTLAEFASGAPVLIDSRVAQNRWEQQAIAERALSLLGKVYDLLRFNCEHAANWAQNGRAESPQIRFVFGLLFILVGLAVIYLIARDA